MPAEATTTTVTAAAGKVVLTVVVTVELRAADLQVTSAASYSLYSLNSPPQIDDEGLQPF